MNQPQIFVSPHPKPSLHPPTLFFWVVPEHWILDALIHASNLHWSSVLHMVMYMFQCYSLKSSHPLLLLLSPKVCSLHLCLLCCSVCRRVGTIFLDSICIHYYTVFVFPFLTDFPLYNGLQIYPPHLGLTMSHLLNMHY